MIFSPLPYQQQGIRHLVETPRALLFAEMGLGKTAMVLSALQELFADGACRGALVVAPLRVATLQWPSEVEKWADFRWMRVANLRTKEGWGALLRGDAHIYTCNYEMLPRLAETFFYNRRGRYPFDTLVLDELTKAKNPRSKRIRTLKPYLPRFNRRWGLTGTPMPNSELDLFGQALVIDDGAALGPSFTAFRDGFFQGDYMGYSYDLRPGAKAQIEQKLSRMALTLLASEHLGIEDTHTEDVEVSLPDDAREHYQELEKELLTLLRNGAEVVAVNAAVLVNKLLQVASGSIYDAEGNAHGLHHAKIEALRELVTWLGEPVIVAVNYRHERAQILKAFPQAREWSDRLLEPWNRGEVPMLVADPRSIGHGLNLQAGGRTTIWFSPPWSRELYDQLNARTARRGQTRKPLVYRIVAKDTMDEAVLEALRQKHEGQSGLMASLVALQKMLYA